MGVDVKMKPISWDAYFMAVAMVSCYRSKDPNTQVGAVLVDERNRIVGVGYNGMPGGLDDEFSWEREGEDTKYPYVVHAEMNAILNSTKQLQGCKAYVTLFPCSGCAKAMVQAGIVEVVYDSDKYLDTDDNKCAKKIFNKCGVKYRELHPIN